MVFNYGILDLCPFLYLSRSWKVPSAIANFIQLRDFSCCTTSICVQLDFLLLPLVFPSLVVAVVPALAYRNVYLIWRIFFRYYHNRFRHFRLRLLYNRPHLWFQHGMPSLLSFLYLSDLGRFPSSHCLHSASGTFHCYCASIAIQLDFYFSHSFSVLVVAVVPALAYRNVYLIWRMLIGYHITFFCISAYACCITVHICGLFYRVTDFLAILVFIQFYEGFLPAITFIQFQDFSCYCASIYAYSWTSTSPSFSVLVVAVVPALALPKCLPSLVYVYS